MNHNFCQIPRIVELSVENMLGSNNAKNFRFKTLSDLSDFKGIVLSMDSTRIVPMLNECHKMPRNLLNLFRVCVCV